ncbi:hypothetical protein [Pelagibacterium sediminicola]|uniref:hypothetical protein n=1 Tax=Pelagibacterium sediminicola TaxID=2248761 RepID=UPI000E31AC65|nr:hypothetical protein [Pelagibacterium sediminicola]
MLQKIAGSALYIGNAPIAYQTEYEAADFSGVSWTRILGWQTSGDLGAEQAMVTQTLIDNNTTVYAKGTISFPIMSNQFVPNLSDPGQMLFAAARRACKPYPFRAVWGADCEETATVTISNAEPAVVSWTAHGLPNGTPVVFTTSGSLPTGLTPGTTYYVVNADTDTFEVAATPGGSPIDTSGAGSGTHTATAVPVGETDLFAGFALFGVKSGGDASASRLITMPVQPIAPAITI